MFKGNLATCNSKIQNQKNDAKNDATMVGTR